ncbi:hypothetical protein [Powai lake megavirus]|uniref:Uncharacterized protein n=1 Tax=Powai lake megavirus TaxID=1842663 RepID=A0A167RQZ2_9VIRU|nr:hypothetical protein QJ849_gp925 [Powai lake megavirus]ANB51087.1 hypothetical protein [Powai lake megavirus]
MKNIVIVVIIIIIANSLAESINSSDIPIIGYKKLHCYLRNKEYAFPIATLNIPSTAQIISRQNSYRRGELVANIATVEKMELDGEIFDENLAMYCHDGGFGIGFKTGETIELELDLSISYGIKFFPNKEDAIKYYYF